MQIILRLLVVIAAEGIWHKNICMYDLAAHGMYILTYKCKWLWTQVNIERTDMKFLQTSKPLGQLLVEDNDGCSDETGSEAFKYV